MGDLTAAVDQVVAQLSGLEFEGQPLRVTTQLEKLTPPGVWVALESVDHGAGYDESTLRLFLASNDVDEYRAIGRLSAMLDAVRSVLSPTEATTVVGLSVPSLLNELPALRFTTTVTS